MDYQKLLRAIPECFPFRTIEATETVEGYDPLERIISYMHRHDSQNDTTLDVSLFASWTENGWLENYAEALVKVCMT